MTQVERVGHGRAGGVVVDAAGDRQLGEAELLDPRRALAADLDQPVLTGPDTSTTAAELGVGGVEVGPVGTQSQVTSLRGTACDQHVLDGRQRRGCVHGVEVGGCEHVPIVLEQVFERKPEFTIPGKMVG